MPSSKAVKRREEKESIARQLMGKYTSGVVLALYYKASAPPEGANLTCDPGDDGAHAHTIYWSPAESLTLFLHELAHTMVGEEHLGHLGEMSPQARAVFEEAWAWRLAEEVAYKEDIFFDHRLAEKSFATYATKAGLAPLRLAWRHA